MPTLVYPEFILNYADEYADYCIVAFFIVLIISTITWFVDGRKNFTGPRINLDDLANGETVSIAIAGSDGQVYSMNGHTENPVPARGNAKFADEDDLPAGIFGRAELEDQVYDPTNRVNRNGPKKA